MWEHVHQQKDILFIFNHSCAFYSCLQPCAVTMEMATEGPSAKSLLVTVFLLLRRISAMLHIKTVPPVIFPYYCTHEVMTSFSRVNGQNESLCTAHMISWICQMKQHHQCLQILWNFYWAITFSKVSWSFLVLWMQKQKTAGLTSFIFFHESVWNVFLSQSIQSSDQNMFMTFFI